MSAHHEPDQEFVSQLEWQLRTALKRKNRFSHPVQHDYGGKMKAAALIMVSALMGAGGVVVNDEVQEARQKELLLARVTAEIEVAALEYDLTTEQVEEVTRQYQAGVIEEEAVLASRMALEESEARLAGLRLDLEEIQISGREPQNQLSAPLVGGRDFVTERLVLREGVAAQGRELARRRLARIQDLREGGVVGEEEVAQGMLALREVEAQLESIQNLLSFRGRFLDGEIQAVAAEKELEILETLNRIDLARMALDEAMIRFERVEERVRAGVLHESELSEARIQLVQKQIELDRLQRTLEVLRRTGTRP